MACADGSVNAQLEAWLEVHATNGETIECLIDTGFNGSLLLPRMEATRLGLTVLGRVPIIGVGRTRAVADIAELEVEGLGERQAIEVIISDGDDLLLGTGMLTGSRLIIDYIAHALTVSDKAS